MSQSRRLSMAAACLLLLAFCATAVHADVYFTATHVVVDTYFSVVDHGNCEGDAEPFPLAWNPHNDSTACAPETGTSVLDVKGINWCHFKIIDEYGQCMHLNSRVDYAGMTQVGSHHLVIRIPLNQVLTENNISVSGGYFNDIVFYRVDSAFRLERNVTYRLQVTSQSDLCGSSKERESIRLSQSVTIPCCVGMRGNVDCSEDDVVSPSDLTALVDVLFGSLNPPCCFNEADLDDSGEITLADLTIMIDHLYITLNPLIDCR